jgi:hypothetical protein
VDICWPCWFRIVGRQRDEQSRARPAPACKSA